MGEVYRATDSALERTVAVKLLSDRYARQDDARARFRREALAAARLSHDAERRDRLRRRRAPTVGRSSSWSTSTAARSTSGFASGRVSRAQALDLARAGGRARSTAHMRAASSTATSSRRTSSSTATATSTSPTSGSRRPRGRHADGSRGRCSAPPATSRRSRHGASPRPRRATATRSASSRSSCSPDAGRSRATRRRPRRSPISTRRPERRRARSDAAAASSTRLRVGAREGSRARGRRTPASLVSMLREALDDARRPRRSRRRSSARAGRAARAASCATTTRVATTRGAARCSRCARRCVVLGPRCRGARHLGRRLPPPQALCAGRARSEAASTSTSRGDDAEASAATPTARRSTRRLRPDAGGRLRRRASAAPAGRARAQGLEYARPRRTRATTSPSRGSPWSLRWRHRAARPLGAHPGPPLRDRRAPAAVGGALCARRGR